MTSSPDANPPRQARVSGRAWLIPALGISLFIALVAVFVILSPELSRSYVSLDSSHPAYIHPDGLVISLTNNDERAEVHIDTVPRELFIADQAGADWATAHAALPARLVPLSPLYTIYTRGDSPLTAEMAIPNGAEPLVLMDLYQWDQDAQQWVFLRSQQDTSRGVVGFKPADSPMTVMAVHVSPEATLMGVVVSEGAPALDLSAYQFAMPEGISIDAEGHLTGSAIQVTTLVSMPVVVNRLGGFTEYEDAGQQSVMINQLVSAALAYQGLVLDFEPADGYAQFLAALAEQVHAHGKELQIVVRGASLEDYHLPELAESIDRIWLVPGDNPNAYLPGGSARTIIESAISQVDRAKLGLWVSGLNVDVSAAEIKPISLDEALALFGSVQVAGDFDSTIPIDPGASLPFRLTGAVDSMGFDIPLGMNYLTYHDGAGETHYVYFSSAQNLARKVAWARYYGLGSIVVQGVAHPYAPNGLAEALQAFARQQPVGSPETLEIVWHVRSASGASLSDSAGDLANIQYLWQAMVDPGDYVVSAGVNVEATEMSRGQVLVRVAESTPVPTATPTPTPTPRPGIVPTRDPNETPAPQPTAAPPSGNIAAGIFELGGQTQTFGHPDDMHRAGMIWVKFQHKWNPGDDPAGAVGGRIADAHARGFKVLLSIPGPSQPDSIDYDAFVNFVAGVAALGPDAIEIWNEMNFNFEWPASEISGENYVNRMLAPAYQAIKSTNPGVMVISGAPTPTGAFAGCGTIQTPGGAITGCDDWFYLQQMRDAGAANYADCVGVHYNEGIIPPSQTSGDPRGDNFYSRYFYGMMNTYSIFGKPLCFTELGYLSPEGYGQLPPNFAWAQNTTVGQQAEWLSEAAVLASQSGKVRMMIIFNVDFTSWGADPQAGYAMIRPGGGCPACDTLAAVQP